MVCIMLRLCVDIKPCRTNIAGLLLSPLRKSAFAVMSLGRVTEIGSERTGVNAKKQTSRQTYCSIRNGFFFAFLFVFVVTVRRIAESKVPSSDLY